MISNKLRIMKHLAKMYDLFALVVAFISATFVLYSSASWIHVTEFLAFRITLANGLLFGLLLVAWHNLFNLCGLYTSKRLTPRTSEIYDVCKATLFAALFLLVTAKLVHVQMVNVIFVVCMWVICTVVMLLGRIIARSLLMFVRRRGRNTRFLVIVGTNHRAIDFADGIRRRPELGYSIVGFIDDNWARTPNFEASGHSRCCTFSGLAEFLRHNVVDEAAMFLPLRSRYEDAARLVSLFEQQGIAIRTDSQIFKLISTDLPGLDIDDNSQLMAVARSIKALPAALKRCVDLVGSLMLLVFLCPLFLAVGLLVKVMSKGPIFFRQTRVGMNKRRFTIYKFRTMVADAESIQNELVSMNEMTGPVFKIKEDPRITPLGKALRKTSIDELPQLFNVLKGEMSLVGPRAMSLRDYQLFDQDCHRRRFSVKPGITCLWQIYGRNSIPFEQWMELDLQYIDKWSLWLDIKILAQTVPAVLRGTGAA
jgi:exopolysaccharide biosynthesis polyprenyl glycosylphosphotransferase